MPSTVLDYTLSNTPPGGITAPIGGTAPSNTPPVGIDPAIGGAAPSNVAPGIIDLAMVPDNTAAIPLSITGAYSSFTDMPSNFTPAFNGLTGGGNTLANLSANAADATAARIVQGIVNGELRSYQVRAGTDAQDLPGIVRPANFDAETNAVVFVSV